MSQQSDPYQRPPSNLDYRQVADPYGQLRAPQRRAGIMVFVIGGLFVLGGLCFGMAASVPFSQLQLQPQQAQQFRQFETTYGIPIAHLILGFGLTSAVIGLIYLVLGVFVLRGNRRVALVTIILSTPLVLFLILAVVSGLAQGINPVGLVLPIIVLILLGLLIAWLIEVYRTAPRVEAARVRSQAKYAQHFQQAQEFGAAGYRDQVSGMIAGPPSAPPKEPPPIPNQGATKAGEGD